MELAFGAADAAFRDEVRSFLDERLTPELRAVGRRMTSVYADYDTTMTWHKALYEKGWVAPAWPVEHGGCDWSVIQHYIFSSELAAAGAPALSPMGLGMCGPVLIGYGTEEQKNYYLPRILDGSDFWCQGYSEPGSGSDLASLQMSAKEDGDDFVCNGQKIWTTHANYANRIFNLVRTSNGRHSPAWHHLHPDRHGHARREGGTADHAVRRAHPEPDLLHRRARAEEEPSSARWAKAGRSRNT